MATKKRKKRTKKRTQNKFLNGIISGMRQSFNRYAPKYEEALSVARVEIPQHNKDGSESKRPLVKYRCKRCEKLYSKSSIDIDHLDPVIPLNKSYKDFTLDQILERLDCAISNLQALCKRCHKLKSSRERKVRLENRKSGED